MNLSKLLLDCKNRCLGDRGHILQRFNALSIELKNFLFCNRIRIINFSHTLKSDRVVLRVKDKCLLVSIGFCVAMTRKSLGSGYVFWPTVICRSPIASSRADCTLAGARLISSASTKFVKKGALLKRERGILRAKDIGSSQIRLAVGPV